MLFFLCPSAVRVERIDGRGRSNKSPSSGRSRRYRYDDETWSWPDVVDPPNMRFVRRRSGRRPEFESAFDSLMTNGPPPPYRSRTDRRGYDTVITIPRFGEASSHRRPSSPRAPFDRRTRGRDATIEFERLRVSGDPLYMTARRRGYGDQRRPTIVEHWLQSDDSSSLSDDWSTAGVVPDPPRYPASRHAHHFSRDAELGRGMGISDRPRYYETRTVWPRN